MKKTIRLAILFFLGCQSTTYAQNVGIGTMTPSEKLHVAGNVRITALSGTGNALVLTNNTGVLSRTDLSGSPTDVLDGTGTFVPISSLNDDDWTVAGVNMYNNNTGNVGVGTTTPGQKLSIVGGNVDVNDGIYYLRDNAGSQYGIGYNTLGGTEMVVFSDNLIDFTESDGSVSAVQIQTNAARVEFFGTTDASGAVNTGVIEIGDNLRLDNNEIITNTGTPFYINADNNGDVQMDGGTFHLDASTNRIGVGITTPAYTVQTLAGGSISVNDGYLRQVKALYLQDWDDDTGGSDDKYRLLGRDGAWMFYNGGVVVGNYGDGTWGDLPDGQLIVEDRIGIRTTAPTQPLDVNGTVRIRGGAPNAGDLLMSQNANGDATWSNSGYGMVPIGSILAWHGNMAGVPGLPAGWLECNGQTIADAASPMNGQAVPNLNNATTSDAGNASRGRFLRGNTTSGLYETDQSNNLEWINHDDSGNSDTDDYLADEGGVVTIRNYSTDGDRFQANVDGVETRVTNMSVRWIIRVK